MIKNTTLSDLTGGSAGFYDTQVKVTRAFDGRGAEDADCHRERKAAMITLTDAAVREVKGVMAAQNLTEALLRTGVPRI